MMKLNDLQANYTFWKWYKVLGKLCNLLIKIRSETISFENGNIFLSGMYLHYTQRIRNTPENRFELLFILSILSLSFLKNSEYGYAVSPPMPLVNL